MGMDIERLASLEAAPRTETETVTARLREDEAARELPLLDGVAQTRNRFACRAVGAFALLILLALGPSGGAVPAELDRRELVILPEQMQTHMLANMRDHLRAIGEIQAALADGQFDTASSIAEQRLGASSLASHGAAHMAPYMPAPMRAIGAQMHTAASQFALIAQEASLDADVAHALKALSAVTAQCNACHTAYRIH